MKAVLVVINVPDDVFIEDCIINYEVQELVMMNRVTRGTKRLRPLPEKESEKRREEIGDWTGLAYSQGWNDCLDEITGETE